MKPLFKMLFVVALGLVVFAPSQTAVGQETNGVEASESDSQQIVASKRLFDIIRNGGPLMIPIGICSFILLVFVFERFISLRKGRILPGQFVKRFMQNMADGKLDRDKALELCEKNRSPIGKVFRAAVMKWGKPSVEGEQAVLDAGERAATDMRKYMRLLNGIATVCPLLGLLGTVLGMIHCHRQRGGRRSQSPDRNGHQPSVVNNGRRDERRDSRIDRLHVLLEPD